MKIALLISGGVDSAVALKLLKEQGHDVTAFYLKIWLEDEVAFLGTCPWEEDLSLIREMCAASGTPLEVVPLQKEYWETVIETALLEVKAGRTPNPDMLCNQRVKFGAFVDRIDPAFTHVASGHYARTAVKNGVTHLLRAKDAFKDQTYFLAQLRQAQLEKALFPIGDLTKREVREAAHRFDLPNKDRKDSQGLCFLGKIKFSDFLKHHLGERPGPLIELETGKVVGEHRGFWYHTIGQRQGLRLAGGPWFVVKKSPQDNVIFISRDYHAESKRRDTFAVEAFNPLSNFTPPAGQTHALDVKVRHGESFYKATVTWTTPESATVKLDASDQGLAAGQFAVFYDGPVCVGSGTIQETAR